MPAATTNCWGGCHAVTLKKMEKYGGTARRRLDVGLLERPHSSPPRPQPSTGCGQGKCRWHRYRRPVSQLIGDSPSKKSHHRIERFGNRARFEKVQRDGHTLRSQNTRSRSIRFYHGRALVPILVIRSSADHRAGGAAALELPEEFAGTVGRQMIDPKKGGQSAALSLLVTRSAGIRRA